MKDFAESYTKLVNSISEAQHMKQAMDSINENAKKGKQRNDESTTYLQIHTCLLPNCH